MTIVKYEFVIEEYFSHCKLKVSKKTIRLYIESIRLENLKVITVNKYISVIKTFMKWAFKHELINKDPAREIKLLEKEGRLAIVIRAAQMEQLYQDMEKDQSLRVQDAIMFDVFYGTGVRTNELINVKFNEVNLEAGTLKITEGKGGKERIVAMPNMTIEGLRSYIPEVQRIFPVNEFLFPNRKGKQMKRATVYVRISAILRNILGEKKGAHTLRHSFATVMIERGAPMVAVKEQLGHSSMETTEGYIHNAMARMKELHSKAHPKG